MSVCVCLWVGVVGPQLLHQCCVHGSFEVIRRYLKENARSEAWPLGGVCVCVCVCVSGRGGWDHNCCTHAACRDLLRRFDVI